jgi:hypothetical protein
MQITNETTKSNCSLLAQQFDSGGNFTLDVVNRKPLKISELNDMIEGGL